MENLEYAKKMLSIGEEENGKMKANRTILSVLKETSKQTDHHHIVKTTATLPTCMVCMRPESKQKAPKKHSEEQTVVWNPGQ